MNVTHDQILALLVLKDQRIMALEVELAAALAAATQLGAELANKDALVGELRKQLGQEPEAGKPGGET